MKNRSLIFLVLFACIYILLPSCKKIAENKIEGIWRRVNVVNVNADQFEDWSFTNGYIYILKTVGGISGYDTLSHGEYTITTKLFKKYLTISNSTDVNMNYDWPIDKLTKNVLILYKDEGQQYLEFYK